LKKTYLSGTRARYLWGLIFSLGFALVGGAFNGPLDLHDFLGTLIDSSQPWVDFRTIAPIVVVATVVSNEPEGTPTEARRFSGVFLQLRRITCHLENSLRGPRPADQFVFYYFAEAKSLSVTPMPIHRQVLEAKVGKRYLLFLCRERDILRSIGDVGPYTIPVLSGAHSNTEITSGDLSLSIPYILLKPGANFNSNEFANDILYARSTSDQVGSRLYTVRLLSQLLSQPEPLRSAACFELAHSYYGQYSCLSQLKADPNLPAAVRSHASDVLYEQTRLNAILKQELSDSATLGFTKLPNPDSRKANYEELQLILSDPDLVVRKLACAALQRYYPYQRVQACE
jgi:hypothetical protein